MRFFQIILVFLILFPSQYHREGMFSKSVHGREAKSLKNGIPTCKISSNILNYLNHVICDIPLCTSNCQYTWLMTTCIQPTLGWRMSRKAFFPFLLSPVLSWFPVMIFFEYQLKSQPTSVNPEGSATSVMDFHSEPYLGRVTTSVITTVDFYSVTDM